MNIHPHSSHSLFSVQSNCIFAGDQRMDRQGERQQFQHWLCRWGFCSSQRSEWTKKGNRSDKIIVVVQTDNIDSLFWRVLWSRTEPEQRRMSCFARRFIIRWRAEQKENLSFSLSFELSKHVLTRNRRCVKGRCDGRGGRASLPRSERVVVQCWRTVSTTTWDQRRHGIDVSGAVTRDASHGSHLSFCRSITWPTTCCAICYCQCSATTDPTLSSWEVCCTRGELLASFLTGNRKNDLLYFEKLFSLS